MPQFILRESYAVIVSQFSALRYGTLVHFGPYSSWDGAMGDEPGQISPQSTAAWPKTCAPGIFC